MQLNFNAQNVPVLENNEVLPAGWYNVKIVESKGEQTKDQTGFYLALSFEILDGSFAGRKVFTHVNLENKNPVAKEIGYKTLSSICHCTGVIQLQDSQQLHGIPLAVRVSVRAASKGADGKDYDASNEVKGYRKFDQTVPSTSNTQAPTGQQWQAPVPPQPTFQAPPVQAQPQWQAPPAAPVQQPAWQPPVAPAQSSMPWMQQPTQQQAPVQQPAAAPHAPSHAGFQGQPAPAQQQPTPAATSATPPWMQQPAG